MKQPRYDTEFKLFLALWNVLHFVPRVACISTSLNQNLIKGWALQFRKSEKTEQNTSTSLEKSYFTRKIWNYHAQQESTHLILMHAQGILDASSSSSNSLTDMQKPLGIAIACCNWWKWHVKRNTTSFESSYFRIGHFSLRPSLEGARLTLCKEYDALSSSVNLKNSA